MSEERSDKPIRRVLVALDASASSQEAMAAAAEMAARMEAELLGLFIEDINLFRLAALPFPREVGRFSGQQRVVQQEEVERQLRIQERRTQRLFEDMARQSRVRARFRVTRGPVVTELLSAESGADVLILHGASWSLSGARRLGPEVRVVLAQASRPVMLVRRPRCVHPPVMVVYDGSDLARKALQVGTLLAEEDGGPFIVLLSDGERCEEMREEVSALLSEEAPEALYRVLTQSGTEGLVSRVRRAGCGTLVIPAQDGLLDEDVLLDLIEEIQVSVLLIR